jgi:nicotinate-nucleotide adenylyltransferase
VLGGTFNPPHRGHLALARHAAVQLGLERVLLMPAGRSPYKSAVEDPGPPHRLEMCRLAVAGVDRVGVCALEVERKGPSYTVDTLRALHAKHPDLEVTCILGADVACTLPSWHEAPALPRLARFAVALRADAGASQVREALAPLLGDIRSLAQPPAEQPGGGSVSVSVHRSGSVDFLNMPVYSASSSLVRERIRARQPIDELVEPAVAAYIAAHGLYHAPVAEAPAS